MELRLKDKIILSLCIHIIIYTRAHPNILVVYLYRKLQDETASRKQQNNVTDKHSHLFGVLCTYAICCGDVCFRHFQVLLRYRHLYVSKEKQKANNHDITAEDKQAVNLTLAEKCHSSVAI